jgi:hypothetical protein
VGSTPSPGTILRFLLQKASDGTASRRTSELQAEGCRPDAPGVGGIKTRAWPSFREFCFRLSEATAKAHAKIPNNAAPGRSEEDHAY